MSIWAGPGLGRIITDGFYRTNYGKGIAGAVVVALVALLLELLAATAQRLSDPGRRGSSPNRDLVDAGGMSVTTPSVADETDAVGR